MTKIKTEAKLQPLGDKVLILPDIDEEKTTASGIIVAGQSSNNLTGIVLAVGPGRETDQGNFIHTQLKPGERVVLGTYGHEEVHFDGKKYYMVSESALLASVK